VNEIKGFLENIPTVINNIPTGPQWLKDIIIGAYEDLEISVYPDQFMESINATIPDEYDITIDDLEFGWEALSEKIRFNVTVPTHAREKFVWMKWIVYDEYPYHEFRFKFYSNVDLDILGYNLWYDVYSEYGEVTNPGVSLTPNTWSGQIVVEDNTSHIEAGTYRLFIYFGSSYGWIGVSYNFGYQGTQQEWFGPCIPTTKL
jgi:hypothetical protein